MFQKMAALWWLDTWSDGTRKVLCPSKATSYRYEKIPTLEALSLEIGAEQQLSASGIQKTSFSYQSTNYPTFNGFHILKWPQVCPIQKQEPVLQKQAPEMSSRSKNTQEKTGKTVKSNTTA